MDEPDEAAPELTEESARLRGPELGAGAWSYFGWNPTFSYTRNGRDWVPARELLRSVDPQRPYSKYVGDGKRRIHGIFTEGHANHFHNSLYYLRYENMGFFGAGGRRLGSLRSVPLPIRKLERVYRFTKATGSAPPI
jgi:hypothetical protein